MGGLLHLVQRGVAWAGCGPAQATPRCCTKCNSHPSTASVPTSYHSMWRYNCLCILKGWRRYMCFHQWAWVLYNIAAVYKLNVLQKCLYICCSMKYCRVVIIGPPWPLPCFVVCPKVVRIDALLLWNSARKLTIAASFAAFLCGAFWFQIKNMLKYFTALCNSPQLL